MVGPILSPIDQSSSINHSRTTFKKKKQKALRPNSKNTPFKSPFNLATSSKPGETPLTTQLPTPTTSLPLKMSPTATSSLVQPDSSSAGDIISPNLGETKLPEFTTSLPTKNTTDLFSDYTKKPAVKMIHPCQDYSKFIAWIKDNFSDEIEARDIYFINSVIGLKTYNQMVAYSTFSFREWKDMLGPQTFKACLADFG